MSTKKKWISNKELDWMLFELRCHDLLDALGCPKDPRNRINMRLLAWCKERGIDPDSNSSFGGKKQLPPTPTHDVYGEKRRRESAGKKEVGE